MRFRLILILFISQLFTISTLLADGLSEGYYRIVSAGNGTGYYTGETPPDINYNYEGKVAWYNDGGLVRWAEYDANDYSTIYELKKDGDNWTILNLRDNTYINKGTSNYGGQVSTSKTSIAQTIIPSAQEGKYIIKNAEASFIYSMTSSHNGLDAEFSDLSVWGTPEEGNKFGINLWFLLPVTEEVVSYLRDNDASDGAITISATPETPEPGKKYVIKNATEELYLNTTTGLSSSLSIASEYFWQIEDSGDSVDGYPTYFIKSVDQAGYWQHVDFADKRWDDNSPYDGYDWYGYIGMNAEFGPRENAMEVTILAAGSTSSWRSQNATTGYVLALKEVITTKKEYRYKLGHQNNDVAMEPWEEGVGWFFYPVTDGGDLFYALQTAIANYGNLATDISINSDPGYYSLDKVEAYQAALAAAKAATGNEPRPKLRRLAEELIATAEAMQQTNPIEEGFYYIVTAGNGCGYYSGSTPPDVNYNFENKKAMYNNGEDVGWKDFSPNDFDLIYHFYYDRDNNWFLQSALNGTFIDKGDKTYSTTVHTSIDQVTSQTFELVSEGKFTIKPDGNPYVYSMSATHNGSTSDEGNLNIWGSTDEARKFGVNVWYIKRVPDEVMEEFNRTDAGLMALCTMYELKANSLPTDNAPGYYYADKIEALNDLIATVRERAQTNPGNEEREQMRQQLEATYEAALELKPINDGYYYMVNNFETYNQTYGNYPAIYTTSLAMGNGTTACYYDSFEATNANYIYKVTKQDDTTYSVQNAYTARYLNSGEGTGKSGEIFTSTASPTNNQIIRWHSPGRYWIADTQGQDYGHAIAYPSALNKRFFIAGATTFTEPVTGDLTGYNTWSLLPLTDSEAQALLTAQQTTDQAIKEAYDSMVSYTEEIANDYAKMIDDDDNNYNTDAVTLLKSKYSEIQNYITTRSYDITSTAATYQDAEATLREAFQKVLTTKPDTTSNQQLSGIPMGATSVDYETNQASSTANTPAEAFDNDYSTIYASYDRSTGWVGLDLGKKFIIEKIAYAPRAGWAKRMILGVFEGANKPDFTDALPFYVIREQPEYETLTTDTVICSRGFRYVRYVGPNESRCNISELRFYGKPGSGDDSQLFQLTNLPLVVMRTEANVADVTSKTTWLPGQVNIISDGGTALKSDSMTVRGRGNGSWTFSKKPYKLKLASKSRLLDMPAKAREWTLINNYGDKTLIRNCVAFELSRIFEMDYTPACTLVDVIFNGQYKGSYQLCDQVEVRKDRVDITEMTKEDNEGEALTGGYLIEMDAYSGSEPKRFSSNPYSIPVTIHYPKHDEITDEQYSYINNAFNDMCSRVMSLNYKSETEGYATVLAQDTWLKYFLIAELSGNTDSYWSVYLTKDRNDKFRVSPIWDFDLAFDNDQRTHPILTMTSYLSFSSKSSAATGVRSFNRRIVESCPEELKEIWSWYRFNGNLKPDRLHEVIDSLAAENNQSQELNYIRWDILNTRTQQQYTTRGSYQAEVDYVYEYLSDRISWMDNMVGLEEPVGIHNIQTDSEPHGGIHGHDGYVLVRGFSDGSLVKIYTPDGTLVTSATIQGFDNRYNLTSGIYIIRVTDTNGRTAVRKVAVE
ncbi:MAG: CotH kinase family protein [Bacteroidaceae bacterium]|nr:CotH kinase family protein [Bacteroidaceae bacterium]